jgi:hypothetical protein
MCSGIPFPVPWYLIPLNVLYFTLQMVYAVLDTRTRALKAHVKKILGVDLLTMANLMTFPPKDLKILVAHKPETDFPLVLPPYLTPCGPIVPPVSPVAEVDPELSKWLKGGPVVFVSLGTIKWMMEDEALELAGALRKLLDVAEERGVTRSGSISGKLRVLWKLKQHPQDPNSQFSVGLGSKIHALLGKELDDDRVRIIDWIKPQPIAVLQTGAVVVSVNHGGANSYNDAIM